MKCPKQFGIWMWIDSNLRVQKYSYFIFDIIVLPMHEIAFLEYGATLYIQPFLSRFNHVLRILWIQNAAQFCKSPEHQTKYHPNSSRNFR